MGAGPILWACKDWEVNFLYTHTMRERDLYYVWKYIFKWIVKNASLKTKETRNARFNATSSMIKLSLKTNNQLHSYWYTHADERDYFHAFPLKTWTLSLLLFAKCLRKDEEPHNAKFNVLIDKIKLEDIYQHHTYWDTHTHTYACKHKDIFTHTRSRQSNT